MPWGGFEPPYGRGCIFTKLSPLRRGNFQSSTKAFPTLYGLQPSLAHIHVPVNGPCKNHEASNKFLWEDSNLRDLNWYIFRDNHNEAIRELASGSSPDGKNVATHTIVFYVFTLGLNVICTFLISLRIYMTKRRAAGVIVSSLDLSTTMSIVVESAAIYSACLIARMVPTVLANNVQYIILSMMPGVVFSLIIVRISSQCAPNDTVRPVSDLHFAVSNSRPGTHFATSDEMRSRTDHGDELEIPVHLNNGSRKVLGFYAAAIHTTGQWLIYIASMVIGWLRPPKYPWMAFGATLAPNFGRYYSLLGIRCLRTSTEHRTAPAATGTANSPINGYYRINYTLVQVDGSKYNSKASYAG
ncbi:hypothetical protein B0H11DRAFT_1898849 [Mycena galericulata]|nr:hypothetical protein B0H11DRAFT_1898849 [Mycena galericulata]